MTKYITVNTNDQKNKKIILKVYATISEKEQKNITHESERKNR